MSQRDKHNYGRLTISLLNKRLKEQIYKQVVAVAAASLMSLALYPKHVQQRRVGRV